LTRKELLDHLVSIQYERSDDDLKRGTFRVRGEIIDVFPPYEDFTYRLEIEDGQLKEISIFDPLLGQKNRQLEK